MTGALACRFPTPGRFDGRRRSARHDGALRPALLISLLRDTLAIGLDADSPRVAAHDHREQIAEPMRGDDSQRIVIAEPETDRCRVLGPGSDCVFERRQRFDGMPEAGFEPLMDSGLIRDIPWHVRMQAAQPVLQQFVVLRGDVRGVEVGNVDIGEC